MCTEINQHSWVGRLLMTSWGSEQLIVNVKVRRETSHTGPFVKSINTLSFLSAIHEKSGWSGRYHVALLWPFTLMLCASVYRKRGKCALLCHWCALRTWSCVRPLSHWEFRPLKFRYLVQVFVFFNLKCGYDASYGFYFLNVVFAAV